MELAITHRLHSGASQSGHFQSGQQRRIDLTPHQATAKQSLGHDQGGLARPAAHLRKMQLEDGLGQRNLASLQTDSGPPELPGDLQVFGQPRNSIVGQTDVGDSVPRQRHGSLPRSVETNAILIDPGDRT
ncbi:MAG TPA: hypothetical protein DEO57_03685, partial [Phycisphaerales bacterium]|nr:hypothetical protein [Phycisphaerales bacterium]